MKPAAEPIDYDGPLGISRGEWLKVIGLNLLILLIVYSVATAFTLSGSDAFLLRFKSEPLDNIERTLRNWGLFAMLQYAFASLEATAITAYSVGKARRCWLSFLIFFAVHNVLYYVFWACGSAYPVPLQTGVTIVTMAIITAISHRKDGFKGILYGFLRLAIGLAVSFLLNGLIALFRLRVPEFFDGSIPNAIAFALNVEYGLALVLSLVFLHFAIPFGKRKGERLCQTEVGAFGSSPQSTMKSPTKSGNPKKPNNGLSPDLRRRARLIRLRAIAIQTVAIFVVAFVPWVSGRMTEFALTYVSFYVTRICLGFSHSLHFKSELTCVTVATLVFWGLAYLTPSAEAAIVISLLYGSGTAIGFRVYWELHDLILYRKASKLDRYAMFYSSFKGDVSHRRIAGVMRMRGFDDESIRIVKMYMDGMKVEAIALETNYSKRSVEKRLTDMANDLYARR